MYRIFRPLCVLASAGLLLGAPAVQAADYVLGQQKVIGSTGVGPTGSSVSDFDSINPAIATAPAFNRALVAWSADDPAAVVEGGDDELHFVDDEFEIFARILGTGFLVPDGPHFRVSTMGNNLETDAAARERFDANTPAVAWNPASEEFLVVWAGDDDTAPLVDGEFEIFGQRVSVDGELVGERFRISVMGDDTVADAAERAKYGAANPSVAVGPLGNYLVAWEADDDSAPLVDGETEIFTRILDANAKPLGAQERVSFVGDDSETDAALRAARDAGSPRAVHNGDGFVVAWQADDSQFGLADDEYEIFLQRLGPVMVPDPGCDDPLCPTQPAPAGDPVRVSAMGAHGNAAFDALRPALAVNPQTRALLVAWHGDTGDGALVDGEQEIFARLFDTNLAPLGAQLRVSRMGTDTETDPAERAKYDATAATAAWSGSDQAFLIAWRGDTDAEFEIETGDDETEVRRLVDEEFEIFGRFLHSDSVPATEQFRVSIHGNDLDETPEERVKFGADTPAVAYANGVLLSTWSGDAETSGSFNNLNQVFAQRIAMASTELQLSLPEGYQPPKVPDPIRLDFEMANVGDVAASNVAVRIGMSNEFPMTMTGCALVEDKVCMLGDIAAGDSARFSVILATDHIRLGDEQGTTLVTTTTADTALVSDTAMRNQLFVAATLVIEGGAGAAAWFWLLLGLAPAAYLARRRRRD